MGTVSLLPYSIGPNKPIFKRRGKRLYLLMRIAVKSHSKGCEYREGKN